MSFKDNLRKWLHSSLFINHIKKLRAFILTSPYKNVEWQTGLHNIQHNANFIRDATFYSWRTHFHYSHLFSVQVVYLSFYVNWLPLHIIELFLENLWWLNSDTIFICTYYVFHILHSHYQIPVLLIKWKTCYVFVPVFATPVQRYAANWNLDTSSMPHYPLWHSHWSLF